MSEFKKIGLHLLDDDVAEKIIKKVDFDDLDPSLRTYINNKGSAPSGYDDTDLRNRIINIENKMAASTVEADLATLTQKVNKNTNDINTLDAKKIDTVDAENLKKNIVFTDLDATTRRKITDAYTYYQGIMPSGSIDGSAVTPSTLAATVQEIKKNYLSQNDASANYMKKTDRIAVGMLETSAKNAMEALINSSITGGSGGSGGGSTSLDEDELNKKYRRLDETIKENDIDKEFLDDLKNMASGTNYQELVDKAAIDIGKEINSYRLGTFVGTQKLRSSVSNATEKAAITRPEAGDFGFTKTSDGLKCATFDLTQQRQLNIVSSATIDGVTDSYKLCDILYWLYYIMIGNQFRLTTESFQKAVCNFAQNTNQHSVYSGKYSASQMGMKYNFFSLTDAIIYLTDRIIKVEETINKINNKYYAAADRTPSAKNTDSSLSNVKFI